MSTRPKFPKCFKSSSKPSNFCPGCGHSIVLKNLGFTIDDLGVASKTVFATDIGCSLLAWDYFDIDTIQGHHGRVIPLSVGLKKGNEKSVVISYMGDGGGYAIGLHHLIHAAKRNEPITVILVNNTVFAMTGGQSAPTTMAGEETETTPEGKFVEGPFFGPELLKGIVAENAFLARCSVDNIPQLQKTLKAALDNQINNKSFSFVEVLSYCPTNWKTNARETFDFLDKIKKTYNVGVTEND